MSKKRPRPKQKMPAEQKRSFIRIVITLVVLSLVWIVFAPGSGILSYVNKHAELKRLEKETLQIERDNIALQKKIDLLLNDPEYLEKVARKDHNLLKKNEHVYDFSKKKSTQK